MQFVIFAHARSGSSSLYETLQLHPALNIIEEPFSEDYTKWYPGADDYRSRVTDEGSLDAVLADVFARYNGLKTLHHQLPAALNDHLLLAPGRKVVFLRRKNLLRAVVSGLIGEQTGLWKTWDASRPLHDYYSDLAPISVDQVRHGVAELRESMSRYDRLVSRLPERSLLKLTYEEIYTTGRAEAEACLARLFRFLGVEPLVSDQTRPFLDPAQAQLNSPTTYEYVPNLKQIERECGNDETGWLLREE